MHQVQVYTYRHTGKKSQHVNHVVQIGIGAEHTPLLRELNSMN